MLESLLRFPRLIQGTLTLRVPPKKELAGWASSRLKELGGLEEFAGLFELLEFAARALEFFFSFRHVVADSVDLVKYDVDRCPLLPRFAS
jgi:hypothetical protein